MNQRDLCDAFIRISQEVYRWMERAWRARNPSFGKHAHLWGMQLHETTLTDYVILRLLEECAPAISVFTFTPMLEAKTGADMEMWITDKFGYWLGLRIQCKILHQDGHFKKLHYRPNAKYQCDLLIESAKRTPGCLPIYLLFVGPHRAKPFPNCPCWLWKPDCWQRTWGNWWLSAYQVRRLRPNDDLVTLRNNMVPWHCIVCYDWGKALTSVDARIVYAYLVATVFIRDLDTIRDIIRGGTPTQRPPEYVALAREGRLPDAVDELQRLLEGKEMQHLLIVDLGQMEG